MTNYRRAFIENSYVFITVVTFNRHPILIDNIDLLKESIRNSQKYFNYQIIGLVILPEHFHIIIKPNIIHEYPRIIASIKYYFSRNSNLTIHYSSHQTLNNSQLKKREKGIWQRRYWEHTIKDQEDLNRHLDYIHYNPVKHRAVSSVRDWMYSTFHEFVKLGYYDVNWGSIDDIKHIGYKLR